jgi:flavodoxin
MEETVMKTLIVFDSFFGNTEKIARAIGDELAGTSDVEIIRVGDFRPEHLADLGLLIVGSPTRAFRPSPATGKFLAGFPEGGLKGIKTGAFDTRISEGDVNFMLRVMMKVFGYAAKPISDKLSKRGGVVAAHPEGFIVSGKEGPLKEGELERARSWAQRIVEAR